MTLPARASKLDPYGEEILTLHRQGRKLAEISKHLAQTYGLSVALSTLSEYVKRPRTGGAPPATPAPSGTPAQEMLLDQVEVYAEIQASVRVLVEEMQAIRNAFPDIAGIERRLETLSRQMDGMRTGSAPALPGRLQGDLETMLAKLGTFLERQRPPERPIAGGVPGSLLRRIWLRALGITAVLWLAALAGVSYWLGLWHFPHP